MKIKYTKVLFAATAALTLGSCANHDLIPDIAQVGQAVPTVYWEVASTACKAGEPFSFKGKYTVEPGRTPLRAEVWYQMLRADNAAVSATLGGASLSYKQSAAQTDTVRSFQCYASFPHDENNWNGHEYVMTGEVPTSRTFAPVSWVEPTEWDQERFDTYYPADFEKTFCEKVISYLTDKETADSYYNALRTVFLNYAFTLEQIAGAGIACEGLDLCGDDNGTSAKSDAWFVTKEADESAITGYYYITVDADGNAVYNEVAKDYTPSEGQVIYPVYNACAWVFCRYDDNTGGIKVSVRPEYLPKFRTLLEQIPFKDWIYDNANSNYKIEFTRNYSLEANFRAYDKDTDRLNDASAPEYEGVTSITEQKTITLN